MKSYLACLVLACVLVVSVSADDYEKCKNDYKSFFGCVKSEYEKKSDSEKAKAKQERKDKANKCFADADCDAPDWDANPMGGKGAGRGGKGMGMNMPPKVKECLKKKLMNKIGDKMNPCLSKKGIKNLNFSAMADMTKDAGGFGMDEDGEAKAGIEGAMKAKFNAVKAVDKCAQKKGGDTNHASIRKLEQCLQNVKKDEKPRVCALVKPCTSKVNTGDCKKRGEALMKALCQCKKEKEAEIAKKLKELGQKQQKVGLQELIKTVADDADMQDMMKEVDQCYKDNNEDEPAMLKLAIQVMSGSGSGGMGAAMGKAFSVNASTVIIMGDMMALDAADETECQPCP